MYVQILVMMTSVCFSSARKFETYIHTYINFVCDLLHSEVHDFLVAYHMCTLTVYDKMIYYDTSLVLNQVKL